jgi:hypothetical protein
VQDPAAPRAPRRACLACGNVVPEMELRIASMDGSRFDLLVPVLASIREVRQQIASARGVVFGLIALFANGEEHALLDGQRLDLIGLRPPPTLFMLLYEDRYWTTYGRGVTISEDGLVARRADEFYEVHVQGGENVGIATFDTAHPDGRVRVNETVQDGLAHSRGVAVGDVIASVNGLPVDSAHCTACEVDELPKTVGFERPVPGPRTATGGATMADGTHYWEIEVAGGCVDFTVGAVRPGIDHNRLFPPDGRVYLLSGANCGLIGGPHGLSRASQPGPPLATGDRIGCLLDLDAGSLLFYRNGAPLGPGFPAGVTGPLVRAMTMWTPGCAGAGVPDPEPPAGL